MDLRPYGVDAMELRRWMVREPVHVLDTFTKRRDRRYVRLRYDIGHCSSMSFLYTVCCVELCLDTRSTFTVLQAIVDFIAAVAQFPADRRGTNCIETSSCSRFCIWNDFLMDDDATPRFD